MLKPPAYPNVTFYIGETSPKSFTITKHLPDNHIFTPDCPLQLDYTINILQAIDGLAKVSEDTTTNINTFTVTLNLPTNPTLTNYKIEVKIMNINGIFQETIGYFFLIPSCPDPPLPA